MEHLTYNIISLPRELRDPGGIYFLLKQNTKTKIRFTHFVLEFFLLTE
jgi:hypothetical protein